MFCNFAHFFFQRKGTFHVFAESRYLVFVFRKKYQGVNFQDICLCKTDIFNINFPGLPLMLCGICPDYSSQKYITPLKGGKFLL